MSDRLVFTTVADGLLKTIETSLPRLRSISDAVAGEPRAPGKWSGKQLLGHLIDSAANNHQRFVRAQQGNELEFPAYAQEHWVGCQYYNDRPWGELVELWDAYNRHVAHVLRHIPNERREIPCTIGSNAPVTLGFVAEDYVAHLEHHLEQLKEATIGSRVTG